MASEQCYKPSEQTNHCAQTTNCYQNTTRTDACHDKYKPTRHELSFTDKVKELAHTATKIFQPIDHHGYAAHNGHCAHGHGHGHGHGHSAHSHEHGHSAHSYEHGYTAQSHGYKPTANDSTGAAHGGLNGHTANNGGSCFPKSHEHGYKPTPNHSTGAAHGGLNGNTANNGGTCFPKSHEHGYKPTANHSTGAAYGGLNGHTANDGGACFPKSHEHKNNKHIENKLSGCSSKSECDYEAPKYTC